MTHNKETPVFDDRPAKMIDTSFDVYDENVIDIYSNKISIVGQQHNIKPGYYKVLNMTRDNSNETALVYIREDDWRFHYDEDRNNVIEDTFMIETVTANDETYGISSFFNANTYHDNHAMKMELLNLICTQMTKILYSF